MDIHFSTGYGGAPKCEINIDGVWHIIELQHVKEFLQKAINAKGYTVTKTKQQKYPRITINE